MYCNTKDFDQSSYVTFHCVKYFEIFVSCDPNGFDVCFEMISQKCKRKYWSEWFKDEFKLWQVKSFL